MRFEPVVLPDIIQAVHTAIEENAEEVTALDQAIGDGDHVFNLQRGLQALLEQSEGLACLDWAAALQKTGMALMSTIGGASGSLYGTLFVTMAKAAKGRALDLQAFADAFSQGVESVKMRGRADAGEKTMLDVLIPVAETLKAGASSAAPLSDLLDRVSRTAVQGMESTREMVATKGRASFLGERSRGHVDAGARTAQLMICAIAGVLSGQSAAPP
ncbi:MAG: dihydroxyacetone kinase subunit DhaL [Gammaproteobacteria bacterium]